MQVLLVLVVVVLGVAFVAVGPDSGRKPSKNSHWLRVVSNVCVYFSVIIRLLNAMTKQYLPKGKKRNFVWVEKKFYLVGDPLRVR